MIIAAHDGTTWRSTNIIRAELVKSLSAKGSINVPKLVIILCFLAI